MSPQAKFDEDFSVSRLCEVPSYAPVLAAAHAREWAHLYADWNEAVALSDFEAEQKMTDVPTTWVAHHPSHGPMGSVSLVRDDLPDRPAFNPWLASLYIFPEFRNRGLAKLLIHQTLVFLRQKKCPHAYLFTEDKVPFFSKFAFAVHGTTKAKGHDVTIMKWTNPATFLPPHQEIRTRHHYIS